MTAAQAAEIDRMVARLEAKWTRAQPVAGCSQCDHARNRPCQHHRWK